MTGDLFSDEWVAAWGGEIRGSAAYRSAAQRWEWPVLLVARGEGADRHVFLDLYQGECREVRRGTAGDATRAAFVLSADVATWSEVVAGRLDAVGGIARRRITLEKGNLVTLARHAGAARALIATASRTAAAVPPSMVQPPTPVAGIQRHDGFVSTSVGGLRADTLPMRLWRKAKRFGTWNPEDIDFTRDREQWRALTEAQRDVLLRLTALFVAGEESVTLDLLPLLLVIAREGRLEEEMYLTTFLWEEAKHVDFFHNAFLRTVAPDAGDLTRYHSHAYRRIFSEELPSAMSALLMDARPAAQVRASVTYNMVVEGVLAETGYQGYLRALEAHDLLPGLREGIGHLQRDESRHIAYGVYLLSRLIAADGSLWEVAETRMNELFPLALETISDIFSAYDAVPFDMSMDEFVDIATTNYNRRMQRIERARTQTLEDILTGTIEG